MSLDGFSLSSLGLPKDITSAQAAATAEHVAKKGMESKVENIENVMNKRISDDDKKDSKDNFFNDGFEGEAEENEESENASDEEESENKRRRKRSYLEREAENLKIRFNEKKEMVELFNINNNKTVESIKAEDLIMMVSKLDISSGILVNKEI